MTTQDVNFAAAFETVTFDFFKQCIANGSTPEQAKKEMENNKEEIAKRIKEVLH